MADEHPQVRRVDRCSRGRALRSRDRYGLLVDTREDLPDDRTDHPADPPALVPAGRGWSAHLTESAESLTDPSATVPAVPETGGCPAARSAQRAIGRRNNSRTAGGREHRASPVRSSRPRWRSSTRTRWNPARSDSADDPAAGDHGPRPVSPARAHRHRPPAVSARASRRRPLTGGFSIRRSYRHHAARGGP
jgi:hypothetical protein